MTWLADSYQWIKALHIISVIAWMVGLLYLPRLFVYHAMEPVGSATSQTFKTMERRLLRAIMNPAMIATWVFGLALLAANPALGQNGWFHAKLVLVIFLTVAHMLFARWRKRFEADANQRSQKFFRFANEVPTIIMIIVVFLVIVKPF